MRKTLVTFIVSPAFATPALAMTVEMTKINAAPDKVWVYANDFCGIGLKCELSDGGKTRTLSLKGKF